MNINVQCPSFTSTTSVRVVCKNLGTEKCYDVLFINIYYYDLQTLEDEKRYEL